MKCPEYPCAFIAAQEELHYYLESVSQQKHLVININKVEDSKWLKRVCYCVNPCTLKQNNSEKNPGRMFFTCLRHQCKYCKCPLEQKYLRLHFKQTTYNTTEVVEYSISESIRQKRKDPALLCSDGNLVQCGERRFGCLSEIVNTFDCSFYEKQKKYIAFIPLRSDEGGRILIGSF